MTRTRFTDVDVAAFEPSEKIALVATLDDHGEPHVTLLTTLTTLGPTGLTIGEFSRGWSKDFMARRPKVGFLMMGLDRRIWRGRALWRRSAEDGPEYVKYNKQPMFRYNTYFGVNTVHYLDLVDVEGPRPLPMAGIVVSTVATTLLAVGTRPPSPPPVLPPLARAILDSASTLTFLAHVDADGHPRLVPVVQARSAGPSRVVFTAGPWGREVRAIPAGTRTAVFSMNLAMESFLGRGRFGALRGRSLFAVDLDFLYDSAPPAHGQVYPPVPLQPRLDF